jgi:hypothetical protein
MKKGNAERGTRNAEGAVTVSLSRVTCRPGQVNGGSPMMRVMNDVPSRAERSGVEGPRRSLLSILEATAYEACQIPPLACASLRLGRDDTPEVGSLEASGAFRHSLGLRVPRSAYAFLAPRSAFRVPRSAFRVAHCAFRVPRCALRVPRSAFRVPRCFYEA